MTAVKEVESICPFCKQPARKWTTDNERELYGFECDICHLYFISSSLLKTIKDKIVDNDLLNCIHENIRSNPSQSPIISSWHLKSDDLPVLASDITVKRFEDFARVPVDHSHKTNELLKLLGEKATRKGPFEIVNLELKNLYGLKIKTFSEAWRWIKQLQHEEFISPPIHILPKGFREKNEVASAFLISDKRELSKDYRPEEDQISNIYYILTPKGWDEIYDKSKSPISTKVFIAMQFTWENDLLKNKFIESVKDACKFCGYDADIVNQNHLNQITDEIIANIKESHFVIADFTHNNRGAYYEAGLARGLGIPVLHTIMEDHTNDLHFDIKQINYIQWQNPDDLKQKLIFRIKAVIERQNG